MSRRGKFSLPETLGVVVLAGVLWTVVVIADQHSSAHPVQSLIAVQAAVWISFAAVAWYIWRITRR